MDKQEDDLRFCFYSSVPIHRLRRWIVDMGMPHGTTDTTVMYEECDLLRAGQPLRNTSQITISNLEKDIVLGSDPSNEKRQAV